jgi:hypothetical protein
MNNKRYHEQQLVHQHVPLLQNNYSLNVTLKIKAEEAKGITEYKETNQGNTIGIKTGILDKIDFLICQSCFWCASYISPRIYNGMTEQTIAKCPACTRGNVESLPIAQNEKDMFHYDTKRGVTMEFLRYNT